MLIRIILTLVTIFAAASLVLLGGIVGSDPEGRGGRFALRFWAAAIVVLLCNLPIWLAK